MSRIFITGSSDGLGFLAGKLLLEQGHRVVLHARNETKARALKDKLSDCDAVLVGDVSSFAQIKSVAQQANAQGRFDAVIHNVGVYTTADRAPTVDGLTQVFAVNVVAPYILTALVERPQRLIYMSSGMHTGGEESLQDPQWEKRPWSSYQAYSDTKFYDLTMALYLARRWPDVFVNVVNPGWVPTRMGGSGAPDDLLAGATTQVWLATSDEPDAKVSGHYFFHQKQHSYKRDAADPEVQERLIQYLEKITQIRLR